MPAIKTKEGASVCVALLAALLVAAAQLVVARTGAGVRWPLFAALTGGTFCVVLFVALLLIRKYVAYKLGPIYSLVLSRDVHTGEVLDELKKERRVERLGDELKAWAEAEDRELARREESERFRRSYLGSVARELKTPLLNLQGQIEALRDGGLDDELMRGEYLDRAARNTERLVAVARDLDTISRLENGMARLETAPFDAGALARECARKVEAEAAVRGIRIEVCGAATLPSPYWVRADRRYIALALENLLINSIRFGREGGCTRVRFRDMLDRMLIEVKDDGQGIGREELPRIFERFYRTEQSRAGEPAGTGTGLGLAVVKHIVEAHGGHVAARSEEGAGSTFSLVLERAEPGAER